MKKVIFFLDEVFYCKLLLYAYFRDTLYILQLIFKNTNENTFTNMLMFKRLPTL